MRNRTTSTRIIGRVQKSKSRGDMIAGDEIGRRRGFFRRLKRIALKTAVSYGANAVVPGSGAIASQAVSGDYVGKRFKSVKKLAKNRKLQMGLAAATGAGAVIAAQKAYKSDTGQAIKATIKKKYASMTAPSEKVTLSRSEYEKMKKGGETKTEIKYVNAPATATAIPTARADTFSDFVTEETATDTESTAADTAAVKSALPVCLQTPDIDASKQAEQSSTSEMVKKYAPWAIGGVLGVIVLKKVLG